MNVGLVFPVALLLGPVFLESQAFRSNKAGTQKAQFGEDADKLNTIHDSDRGCAKSVRGGVPRVFRKKHQPVRFDALKYAWNSRWNYCKCPHGEVLFGNNSACKRKNRYYRPSDMEGKGCSCVSSWALADAAGDLDLEPLNDSSGCSSVVRGSTSRESQFFRYSTCKCPRYTLVDGEDQSCQSSGRYFRPGQLAGKNCSCKNAALIGEKGKVLRKALQMHSYVGRAVIQYLLDVFPQEKGTTWDMISDLKLPKDWIIQTPPGSLWGKPFGNRHVVDDVDPKNSAYDKDFGLLRCHNDTGCGATGLCQAFKSTVRKPEDPPLKLCIGDADPTVENYYEAIIGARNHVDIVSLESPDWVGVKGSNKKGTRFLAAMRNAFTYLSYLKQPISVRLLFGNVIFEREDTDVIIKELTRDLPKDSQLRIYVSAYRVQDSWVHSKIVAVDGQSLLQGGINFYTNDYLMEHPVYDLSMKATGKVALTGHRHADLLWKQICKLKLRVSYFTNGTVTSSVKDHRSKQNGGAWPCTQRKFSTAGEPPVATGKLAIPIARLGDLGSNPSDRAFQIMFLSAQSTIKISQQDLGPFGGRLGESVYGWLYTTALCNAMGRGVDVYIVLTNPNDIDYSNGWTAEDVKAKFRGHSPGCGSAISHHLHIAYLKALPDWQTWPDGAPVMNHAKFFAIDDVVHYIGSQNLYNSNLAEYGLIIDDQLATADVMDQYWDRLWNQSTHSE